MGSGRIDVWGKGVTMALWEERIIVDEACHALRDGLLIVCVKHVSLGELKESCRIEGKKFKMQVQCQGKRGCVALDCSYSSGSLIFFRFLLKSHV